MRLSKFCFPNIKFYGKFKSLECEVSLDCLPFFLDRVSGAVNTILQKLCTILGLLKDLLLIERLSDSCILQLVRTSFTTFLVDNIQLLQMKAIGLICGVELFTLFLFLES